MRVAELRKVQIENRVAGIFRPRAAAIVAECKVLRLAARHVARIDDTLQAVRLSAD